MNLKKFGFKTIRFPVTWMHFMDKSGKVSSDWMLRVKEVIDWIINLNMYCILNLHHDGTPTNWLSKGLESKDKGNTFIKFKLLSFFSSKIKIALESPVLAQIKCWPI